MKSRLSATIAIYLLSTLLFSTLYTHASQEKSEDTAKLLFSRLLDEKHKPQPFLIQSKNNILFLIVNQFLTCKDVLVLQKTCKFFQNLLQPNPSNMVTFCNYADSKHMTETTIIWDDLKYLQSCCIAFDRMEMFNIPTRSAFAASLNDGSVVAWGEEKYGGKIPDDIQPQLQNVKMIIPNIEYFTAVCKNGKTFTWGFQENIPQTHTNTVHLSILGNDANQFLTKHFFVLIVLLIFSLPLFQFLLTCLDIEAYCFICLVILMFL